MELYAGATFILDFLHEFRLLRTVACFRQTVSPVAPDPDLSRSLVGRPGYLPAPIG